MSQYNGFALLGRIARLPTEARLGSRPYRASFLWALFVGAAIVAQGAFGEDRRGGNGECADVPEGQRPACWMEAGCRQLTDADDRAECLRMAASLRDTLSAESAPADDASELESEVVVAPPAQAPERPVDIQKPKPAQPEAAPPASEPEAVVSERTVDRKVLDIPRRFSGEITALRRLVRDRQLIAVDNQLLFDGDVAAESALKTGDRVDIQRISAFGERYRITGPSQRAVTTRRILCERVDLGRQSRSRCLMVGRDRVE